MTGAIRSFLRRRAAVALLGMTLLALPAMAGPRGKGLPVNSVLELFTSQGCSSCPAADVLFHNLRNEPGVLALSFPVTIWDHLGWKDTLAQQAFSYRQKGYAASRGDRQIYTPQAVINGVLHAVGSDRKALDEARQRSQQMPGVLAITPVLRSTTESWSVVIPDSPLGRPAMPEAPQAGASERKHVHAGNVVLVTFERDLSVDIAKGENGGRTVRYGNIVRTMTRLGEYSGMAVTFELPASTQSSATQGFAVLVQGGTDRHPGMIVGAVESPRE